jgi:DNA-binding MarR family transcriptional regulator
MDADRALSFLETFLAVKRAVSLGGWRSLAHLDLGPAQVRLMREIARRAPVPQGDLAREAGIDPSAASRIVNTLIDQGWILRRRGGADRREAHIELTDAGRRAVARIDRAWLKLALRLTRDLDDRDLAAFERLAAKLLRFADAPDAEAPREPPRRRR